LGRRTIIVSIGGNAIVRRGEQGTIEEQFKNVRRSAGFIARLVRHGFRVAVTHGNGPVVGNILIRNEAARDTVPPMPLYICGADSQGGIGLMIQQTLFNALRGIKNAKGVVAIVTQVVVDPKDPAFRSPSKPIGPFYAKKEARVMGKRLGYVMKEDSLRGFRRFVPSPVPKEIVEADVINRLLDSGFVVIGAGGGGVPVAEDKNGRLKPVDAVIDKDLSTALVAISAKAEAIINLTSVDMVYKGFGTAGQEGLAELSLKDAARHLRAGHFHEGSMAPKIRAAMDFIVAGGREVLITSVDNIGPALNGKAGTRIHA
jgi:carbamate kinase